MSEKPVRDRPRRLADWLNPTGDKTVHSLVDKVYKRKNLEDAWLRVKGNGGAGGVDGQTLMDFENGLAEHLDRLHEELRSDTYEPLAVRRQLIPKAGQPGQFRPLGIPTIYDRVCQQALLNRLEPIFEPVFDDASFGYRRGRSTKDALRKIWKELGAGAEWIIDADLKDFFGSVEHEKLLTLVAQRISDGRVLRPIERMLKAGVLSEGQRLPTEQGTPQGGIVSPLLSNILLTPLDCEMRRRGFRLTRYADDWVITCHTRAEACRVLAEATRILRAPGVTLNVEKARIVHVTTGFEFLGYKIKRGSRPLKLAPGKIRTGRRQGDLSAYPRAKSIEHFKDQLRQRTRRKSPVSTRELIAELNPVIRGWGQYFCKAHIRKLFARLDRWILRRIWSQRFKRWRCRGWKRLPERQLYGELGLVRLIYLIPSLHLRR
jgi:RNA-directed DNA polymerase